jgi:hypothetical protein
MHYNRLHLLPKLVQLTPQMVTETREDTALLIANRWLQSGAQQHLNLASYGLYRSAKKANIHLLLAIRHLLTIRRLQTGRQLLQEVFTKPQAITSILSEQSEPPRQSSSSTSSTYSRLYLATSFRFRQVDRDMALARALTNEIAGAY